MRYRVRADMTVTLETVVEAKGPDEAIETARHVADNGGMREVENSGEIDAWEAWEELE